MQLLWWGAYVNGQIQDERIKQRARMAMSLLAPFVFSAIFLCHFFSCQPCNWWQLSLSTNDGPTVGMQSCNVFHSFPASFSPIVSLLLSLALSRSCFSVFSLVFVFAALGGFVSNGVGKEEYPKDLKYQRAWMALH